MNARINQLFRKYLDNSCNMQELEELFAFIADPANETSMEKLMQENLHPEPKTQIGRRKKFRIAAGMGIAAALALTLFFLWPDEQPEHKATPFLANAKNPVFKTKNITARSEFKYLLLPDSTQVWLNAESSLESGSNFGEKKREVYLKGEAYFDVKHADKIPFIIYTGKVSTEVLGTAFNIKAYPDLEKIVISVNRGKVKVKYADNRSATLTPGQQISVNNQTGKAVEKPRSEISNIPWHEGTLSYDDDMFIDVLSDLERIYNIQIETTGGDINALRISTKFRRAQGVEPALEILCNLTDTKFIQENGIYHITKSLKP